MQVGLRRFSPPTVEWFKAACAAGDRSRSSLARELCEREQWYDPMGRPCLGSARKVLAPLAAGAGVALPAASAPPGDGHRRPTDAYPDTVVAAPLAALGPVSLEPVSGADGRRWEAMMECHHPAGWRRAPGGQLRYWITAPGHGVLGGIGFVAAGCQLAPRDARIGWSADARLANLARVVCNQRFLLLPGVRVHGLASHVLRLATARLADDWAERYGVRPVLAYTFTARDAGWSYRAARWRCCAQLTSGRRSGVRRAVWLKPLAPGWRETLCRVGRRPLGWSDPQPGDGGWAEREYARSLHPDGRTRRRLVAMGRAWQAHLGKPLPEIFPGKAAQQAAYRLLSNRRVGMDHILEPHFEATVERCRAERWVLAIQDTTTLIHDGLIATAGLDALGGGGKGVQGVLAHAGMAVNAAGRPLGLFLMNASFRRADGPDSVRWLEGLDRAMELDAACPETRVVSVCDREGDFWALLRHARRHDAALLVRASRSARRRVRTADGGSEDLWAHVGQAAPVGGRTIEVPASGGPRRRTGRKARLTLRCLAVDLIPPKDVGGAPQRMIAVSAQEEDPPAARRAGQALHWLLLTTEGEPGLETARTVLRWYELRWQIERFFHALKVGTRIEDRRLDLADDLRKCLAFDAITAFRVWDLTWLARLHPEKRASDYVEPEEIEVLFAVARKLDVRVPRGPPDPDIRTFVILTAGLAGFHPSKRQPMPGTKKLWQGMTLLSGAVLGYQAMRDRLQDPWADGDGNDPSQV